MKLGSDYRLDAVKELGPGGWITATQYIKESPGNWMDTAIQELLDTSEKCFRSTVEELNLRGQVIRKKRSVGLVPTSIASMTRESLDETVLRVQEKLFKMNSGYGPVPPFCAFNGGRDAWVDVGNKRVGVVILCAYLGIPPKAALHIGDQFLNTGNDYAARDVCPCIWIINPDETTYILKSILRLGNVSVQLPNDTEVDEDIDETANVSTIGLDAHGNQIDFEEIERRRKVAQEMDVFTGEIVNRSAM
jgi:IMP and pyridine-specific 5'-nucleotidase